MVASFLIFITSYCITLFGFFLGRATTSEHKEIKEKALFFAKAFMFIVYSSILFLSYGTGYFFLSVLAICLFFIEEFKLPQLKEFNYLFTFSLSYFIFLKSQYLELFPLVLFAMILEHSFKKFVLKEILYSLVLLVLLFTTGTYFM